MTDNASQPAPARTSRAGWLKIVVIVAVLAALTSLAFIPAVRTGIAQGFEDLRSWIAGLGLWGPVVLAAMYVVATVLFVPGLILTMAAGSFLGVLVGTVTGSVGSTIGAGAALLVGRTVARRRIERKVAGSAKFAAIDEAVARQGFKIVLLTRLSPIFPFNLLNYAYGLTKVRFGHYALASWIGMLPGTLMYVYIGSGLGSLLEIETREKGLPERIFFWVGLALTIGVVVLVTRVARKALKEAVADAEPAPAGEDANDG